MPRLSEAATFERTISQLMAWRQAYAEGLAQIDGIFAKYNIRVGNGSSATPAVARTRSASVKAPAAAPTRGRRRRGHFDQTGEEFVLSLVRSKSNPTTAQIDAAWTQSGRKGKVSNTLGKLVHERKIKRAPVKDGRGRSSAS